VSRVRLGSITLDCAEPHALADFWAGLLDGEVILTAEAYAVVKLDANLLTTMRVEGYVAPSWPSDEVAKQAHLDLKVDDLELAERRALELGATLASRQPDASTFRVMLDPAGHPFCLTTQIPEEWLDR
jgi:Glyoxalase-like domain